MGAVVQIEQYGQRSEVESWRQGGYAAVEPMIEKLSKEIEGQGFEELSGMLPREGQSVSGALFEEVLKSRGAKERTAPPPVCEECGRTLTRRPQLHRRVLESLHGGIGIERPYFYCRYCRKGYYPFDEELEIAPAKKPYDLPRGGS